MVFATCFLSFLTLLPGLVAAKMLAFRNVMLLEGLINSAVPRCSSDFFFMAATMRLLTESILLWCQEQWLLFSILLLLLLLLKKQWDLYPVH